MKKVLLIIALSSTITAADNNNNEVMTRCLIENGYTPNQLSTYDFSKATICYTDWKTSFDEQQQQQQKAFIEANPWYRGRNWQWEYDAGYSCERIYNNNLMNTITVCSKPIYIN